MKIAEQNQPNFLFALRDYKSITEVCSFQYIYIHINTQDDISFSGDGAPSADLAEVECLCDNGRAWAAEQDPRDSE